jgi:hypothetical protein
VISVYPRSPPAALSDMSPSTDIHPFGALIPEIERYLGIVEYFRSEGCEPQWAPEDAFKDCTACPASPSSYPAPSSRRSV